MSTVNGPFEVAVTPSAVAPSTPAASVTIARVVRAEPSRRALLDALIDGERTAGELVATLPGLTQPTVSRHLRVLREVGLVEVRPDAQRRIYALRADGLVAMDGWINRYRRYWTGHLDALERHLERKHKESQ